MKFNRRTFAFLLAGALSLCATDAFAGIPPPPPGRRLPPGWRWCPRCEGRRRVPSGFLGWTSKPCPECRATGMVRLPPPPPPPPARHVKHHHGHHPVPAARPAHRGQPPTHHAAPQPVTPARRAEPYRHQPRQQPPSRR